MSVTEKIATYDGINTHIRIPEDPTGLVFIAPGAQVSTTSSLIRAVQNAYEERGMATVVANLGGSELIMNDPNNVHGNFSNGLQDVINKYYEDNHYTPDTFELAGHSMGGAATLSIAPNNPVSAVTVFDPTPVNAEVLSEVDSKVVIMVSQVRSFKAAGHRLLDKLGGVDTEHEIHELPTSAERMDGHMFVGAEQSIKHIILSQDEDTSPNFDHGLPDDLDIPEQN